MIITPATVDDTAGGIELLSSALASKCRSIVIHNEAGGNPVALKYDGSDDALTFANGIPLAAGESLVLDVTNKFHNAIRAIAATAADGTVRVHGIEGTG